MFVKCTFEIDDKKNQHFAGIIIHNLQNKDALLEGLLKCFKEQLEQEIVKCLTH